MEVPWPEYPCHVDGPIARARPLLLDADGQPIYGESSGYSWHSAKWDLITGKWDAVCCLGHRPRGRRRPKERG